MLDALGLCRRANTMPRRVRPPHSCPHARLCLARYPVLPLLDLLWVVVSPGLPRAAPPASLRVGPPIRRAAACVLPQRLERCARPSPAWLRCAPGGAEGAVGQTPEAPGQKCRLFFLSAPLSGGAVHGSNPAAPGGYALLFNLPLGCQPRAPLGTVCDWRGARSKCA
jgi:hypothetical protein